MIRLSQNLRGEVCSKMREKTETLFVEDMACRACERKIQEAIGRLEGVSSVAARLRGGRVEVTFDEDRVSVEEIRSAVCGAGYSLGNPARSAFIALGIAGILAGLYGVGNRAGLFNALPTVDATYGYGMLFIAGVLTSVHCVAMCGGIALSQSAAGKEDRRSIAPGVLYNSGRIVSYTLVGGLVGMVGKTFDFSSAAKGMVTGLAGMFMALLGLKMLGAFALMPRIPLRKPSFPQAARGWIFAKSGMRAPFAIGLLNGLMPCGPLQSMQLYALGTGSFIEGALSMFLFSLGTAPLMLGFGYITRLLPKKFLPVMAKASSLVVLTLGILTIGRAGALAGIPMPGEAGSRAFLEAEAQEGGGLAALAAANAEGMAFAVAGEKVQTITTDFGSSGNYLPFAVQEGIPVRWTIRVEADGLNGCNNPITVPAFGIRKRLKPGDNVIEFTPKKKGVIVYTCWMGMISSRILVVESIPGKP